MGYVLVYPIEQADETWLTPFKNDISVQWDFTAIHVNKNNMAGVKLDIVSRGCDFPKGGQKVWELDLRLTGSVAAPAN
jgi:hypothetical protein